MRITIVGDYDRAHSRLIRDAMDRSLLNVFPISNSPIRVTTHKGPIRNVSGAVPLDQPLQKQIFGATWSSDIDLNTDIDMHAEFVKELAKDREKSLIPGLLKTQSQVMDAVGNSVNAGGTLSHELIFDVLEKIDIWFDDDGKCFLQITESETEFYVQSGSNGRQIQPYGRYPSCLAFYFVSLLPPVTDSKFITLVTKQPPSVEQIAHHAEIIVRKRAEFCDRSRSRRLSVKA